MTIQSLGTPGNLPLPQSTMAATSAAGQQNNPGTITADKTRQSSNPPAEVKPGDLDSAIKEIQDFLKNANTSLDFQVDQDTDKLVVKVIDTSTHEVIKQIPSEDALALAKALDKMKGLLVSQQA